MRSPHQTIRTGNEGSTESYNHLSLTIDGRSAVLALA